jgi:hypothetical protein
MEGGLPQAELDHSIPGRSRLRIRTRRGDTVYFASVATGLSTLQGARKVEVRPLTGSILIYHDVPLDGIIKAAEEARLFTLEATTGPQFLGAMEAEPVDVRLLLALGFGALALLQLGRGVVLPQAATLAWYALAVSGLIPIGGVSAASGVTDGDAGA